ncbi:DUF3631 domain-containing protein [Pseudolysinimonas sp.]|uniref:DUF3631 domain-containing protein n=1 Tax=Pseudolysinimonas sp. TaxID=2680009 RepID=UPI003784E87A
MTPRPPKAPAAPAGADVLDSIEAFLRRFVAYPSEHARVAHTVWIAHTHLARCFDNSPRLAFLSPEPGSGKSRALEVTEPLVPDAVLTVNATVSYLFRRLSVEDEVPLPTLLFDEVDSIFTNRPSESTEEIRGLLNSGYRKGAVVGRASVRGKEVVTEEWSSFAPVAMAGLNSLPDTLMTRSIVIAMRRRSPSEQIEPYRRRATEADAAILRADLERWALSARPLVEGVWPELPLTIVDRNADVWEPLIAIADAAGGEWPTRLRAAAVAMVDEQSHRPATLGIRLLADLRAVFDAEGEEALRTTVILDALVSMETAPWASIKGTPIDSRFIARQLSKYGVPTNNTIRFGSLGTAKGYARHHLADAWERYLPAEPETDEAPPPASTLFDEDEPF